MSVTPGLTLVTSSIIDPSKTSEDLFNRFYDQEHLPDILHYPHPKAPKIAKRYKNIDPASKNQYLALYPISDASVYGSSDVQKLAKDVSISRTFDNKPVSDFINATTNRYAKVQTYEGLHDPASQPDMTTHAKFLLVAAYELHSGQEQNFDNWYRKQHLDMIAMQPSFRRCTRYTRVDGAEPRHLAVHEFTNRAGFEADAAVFRDKIGRTEWSQEVIKGTKAWEINLYESITVQGDVSLQL